MGATVYDLKAIVSISLDYFNLLFGGATRVRASEVSPSKSMALDNLSTIFPPTIPVIWRRRSLGDGTILDDRDYDGPIAIVGGAKRVHGWMRGVP